MTLCFPVTVLKTNLEDFQAGKDKQSCASLTVFPVGKLSTRVHGVRAFQNVLQSGGSRRTSHDSHTLPKLAVNPRIFTSQISALLRSKTPCKA